MDRVRQRLVAIFDQRDGDAHDRAKSAVTAVERGHRRGRGGIDAQSGERADNGEENETAGGELLL